MTDPRLLAFVQRVEAEYNARMLREYPRRAERGAHDAVTVHPGPKYTRVDVGESGKYMVVNETGEIYGIKAYGVIHRGRAYGTLDTIGLWDWSGYAATRKVVR